MGITSNWAQTVDGIQIPSAHPRLWFNSARLTQARAWFSGHSFTPDPADHIAQALYDLLSGTTTYTSTAVNWAASYEMPMSGVTCDQCRWDGEALILVYDWEYPNLTATQKSILISNYNSWITYWMSQMWGGPTMPQSNYFWGYLRNECEWGITSYGDSSSAQTFLDDCLTTRWTNAFAPTTAPGGSAAGGLPQEGDEYGRYMTWYPLVPFISADLDGRHLYKEANNLFEASIFDLIYSTSQEQVTHVGGGNHWEIFPFSDDENFVYGGSAEAQFSGQDGTGSYTGDFMSTIANYYSSVAAGQYAKQWLNNLALPLANHVAAVDNTSSLIARSYSSLALDYYDTGIQYFYGHSAWGASGTTDFMLQMGAPRGIGHAHDDYGSWQIRRNGPSTAFWLSRETVGYNETYTSYANPQQWRAKTSYPVNSRVLPSPPNGYAYQQVANTTCTSGGSQPTVPTAALATVSDNTCTWLNTYNTLSGDRASVVDHAVHNGVLMNGLGLAYGVKNSLPSVYRLESQSNYTYADVDLTGSYRNNVVLPSHQERDNPAAGHVEREFIFVRPFETMVILDRLVSSAVGTLPATVITKTFIAHCEVNWTLEDSTHESCTNGNQALRISTLAPSGFTQRVVNESSCPGAQAPCNTDGQYRLELDTSGVAEQYFLNVLQARDSIAPNLTASVVDSNPVDPTSGTFTITLHPASGFDAVIVFNKTTCAVGPGQCSSGGTINVGGLGVINLRPDVQGISYTDDGPVWATP